MTGLRQHREQFLQIGAGPILHEQHMAVFQIGFLGRVTHVEQTGEPGGRKDECVQDERGLTGLGLV